MNAQESSRSEYLSRQEKEIVIKRSVLQSLLFATASGLLSTGAVAQESEDGNRAGKLAFNTSCRTCHSLREGDNRLGPNLHNIVGRQAGSAEYSYSPAMKSSAVVWDAETLDRFIENPEAVVPGHNMKPYGGISDDEIRASIVAHLVAESEDDGGG
jgi:cytochrome c